MPTPIEAALLALYEALKLLQPADKLEKFDEQWRKDHDEFTAALAGGDVDRLNRLIAKYRDLQL